MSTVNAFSTTSDHSSLFYHTRIQHRGIFMSTFWTFHKRKLSKNKTKAIKSDKKRLKFAFFGIMITIFLYRIILACSHIVMVFNSIWSLFGSLGSSMEQLLVDGVKKIGTLVKNVWTWLENGADAAKTKIDTVRSTVQTQTQQATTLIDQGVNLWQQAVNNGITMTQTAWKKAVDLGETVTSVATNTAAAGVWLVNQVVNTTNQTVQGFTQTENTMTEQGIPVSADIARPTTSDIQPTDTVQTQEVSSQSPQSIWLATTSTQPSQWVIDSSPVHTEDINTSWNPVLIIPIPPTIPPTIPATYTSNQTTPTAYQQSNTIGSAETTEATESAETSTVTNQYVAPISTQAPISTENIPVINPPIASVTNFMPQTPVVQVTPPIPNTSS